MFLFAIGFLAGDLYVQSLSALPTNAILLAMAMLCLMIYFITRKHVLYAYLLIAFTLGFTYTAWYANHILSWTLPHESEGKPLLLRGSIVSLPSQKQWATSFLFAVTEPFHAKIKLSERQLPNLNVGDEWQFLARLKRIHSTKNPGGYDYEAWALQSKLRATGYIVASNDNKKLAHHWYVSTINQVRQYLQTQLNQHLPASKTAPWLMALTIGERNNISADDWEVLRNTGTNHLLAIAGLHIGIIAALAHFFVSWSWRRFPSLLLRFPAQHAGACGALIAAISYSAMAGFSIPTKRACIMLIVLMMGLLRRRQLNPWNTWALAMLLVMLLNPLSLLEESFWLSFGTIALIIYGMSGRLQTNSFWWKWGRAQWIIGIGLIPLSLLFFQQCSLISFVANTIAIPWLSFFILPFTFFATLFIFISPTVTSFLLAIADFSLSGLWKILNFLAHLHFAVWHQAMPSMMILIITTIGILILLLPAGFPGRYIGSIWILPLLFFKPATPELGKYWLTLLDVGQGLSVVVQTHSHVLVFDAGPRFSADFDMGESVVVPYLRQIGIQKVDEMIISHGDNDHIGGAKAIMNAFDVTAIHTSVPEKFGHANLCLAGVAWQWDQVQFRFLHPSAEMLDLDNNSSCVLRIDNGKQHVLLTGDIEKQAEQELVANHAAELMADVLVAPHHGSKTSGFKPFVSRVHPTYVLYAIGYRNRYHFPNASIVHTYDSIHATQLDTATAGAIQFKFNQPPSLYRQMNRHYWFD